MFPSYVYIGDDVAPYVAAAGHNGNKSRDLVRHYSQDLRFEYLCTSDKNEALNAIERFLTPELTERPILFEAFTDYEDENKSFELVRQCKQEFKSTLKFHVKRSVKKFTGVKGTERIKELMRRK